MYIIHLLQYNILNLLKKSRTILSVGTLLIYLTFNLKQHIIIDWNTNTIYFWF